MALPKGPQSRKAWSLIPPLFNLALPVVITIKHVARIAPAEQVETGFVPWLKPVYIIFQALILALAVLQTSYPQVTLLFDRINGAQNISLVFPVVFLILLTHGQKSIDFTAACFHYNIIHQPLSWLAIRTGIAPALLHVPGAIYTPFRTFLVGHMFSGGGYLVAIPYWYPATFPGEDMKDGNSRFWFMANSFGSVLVLPILLCWFMSSRKPPHPLPPAPTASPPTSGASAVAPPGSDDTFAQRLNAKPFPKYISAVPKRPRHTVAIKFHDRHEQDISMLSAQALRLPSLPPGSLVHVGSGCIHLTMDLDIGDRSAIGSGGLQALMEDVLGTTGRPGPLAPFGFNPVGGGGGDGGPTADAVTVFIDGSFFAVRRGPDGEFVIEEVREETEVVGLDGGGGRGGAGGGVGDAAQQQQLVAAPPLLLTSVSPRALPAGVGGRLEVTLSGARAGDVVAAFADRPGTHGRGAGLHPVAEAVVGPDGGPVSLDISAGEAAQGALMVRARRVGPGSQGLHASAAVSALEPVLLIPGAAAAGELESLDQAMRRQHGEEVANSLLSDVATALTGADVGGEGKLASHVAVAVVGHLVQSEAAAAVAVVTRAVAAAGHGGHLAGAGLLHQAVQMRSPNLVRALSDPAAGLSLGAEGPMEKGITALHLAARDEDAAMLRALLAARPAEAARVAMRAMDSDGETPLACAEGLGHRAHVDLILRTGGAPKGGRRAWVPWLLALAVAASAVGVGAWLAMVRPEGSCPGGVCASGTVR